MKKKKKIIDQICKRHPAAGVYKGWSYYIGGMKDTGEWYTRKMLDCPKKELQEFLNKLIEEEKKPRQQASQCQKVSTLNNAWYKEEEMKRIKKMKEDEEKFVFAVQ
jgi:hypothetical protein